MERFFSIVILLVAAVLLVPGCFAEETTVEAVETVTPVETIDDEAEVTEDAAATEVAEEETVEATYTVDVNMTNLTMAIDETAIISLAENPTTGYDWNVTNTSGLEIVSDVHVQDEAEEGMVGVGGFHTWVIKAVETGEQTFTAVMEHVSEPATGDEETYTLDVIVE